MTLYGLSVLFDVHPTANSGAPKETANAAIRSVVLSMTFSKVKNLILFGPSDARGSSIHWSKRFGDPKRFHQFRNIF